VRKGISILFALAIILSGAHFTIATHYCGGEVAATKVSLSGKLASCGMESAEQSCPVSGNHLKTHFCDNSVTTIGIVDNFTLPVSFQEENTQINVHILYLPISQSFQTLTFFNHLYTDIGPPGSFSASAVNLNDICVFRI
jgi:hypothetical protein